MQRLGRWFGGALALCLTIYLLAALLGGILARKGAAVAAPGDVTIYLVQGPIHYDFLLPNDAVTRADFDWLRAEGVALDTPNAAWIMVGWGGLEFYTTIGTYRDVTARAVWRGVTGDHSVMRVNLTGAVQPDWPVRPISLSTETYQRLRSAILGSFADRAGTAAMDRPGFGAHDRFFPAKGRFHILNTCNVWVGRMLRAAGLRFGTWTPTPYAVTLSHRLYLSP